MPTVAQLINPHPIHAAYASRWALLTRLIEGGMSVTLQDKQNLLRHPDNRPEALKKKRADVAHLSPILGGLVVKLQSQIMRTPGVYEANRIGTTTATDDPFWAEFINAAAQDDEDSYSFHQALAKTLLQSLTTGAGYVQVDVPATPEALTRAEQSEMGGDRPFLVLRNREDILDWERDRNGYKFAKIHTMGFDRDGWDSTPVPTHSYQIYQRLADGSITSQTWKIRPKATKAIEFTPQEGDYIDLVSEEQEIFHLPIRGENIYRFPLIPMSIPKELAVGGQLYETFVQFFTQMAGINYASLVSLWRQLIFMGISDPGELQARINTGANDGFFWPMKPGEDVKWLECDTGGLEFALKYGEHLKGEMLEQIAQIAASAAASYAGLNRSGESKKEDRRNLDILLESYGATVRKTAHAILDCATVARGEEWLDWNVKGFSKYDSDGLLEDLEEYNAAAPVVDSPTFTKEGRKAIASAAATSLGLHPSVVPAILAEIEDGDEDEQEPSVTEPPDEESPAMDDATGEEE
jgi:hypothetical protein